jgi:DNA-directed RNA polymerase subunit M/transcription elongation factor TFIIS
MCRKTAGPSPNNAERDQPEYVYTQRPRCPICGSPRLKAYKTRKNGDDSVTRYSKCLACGRRLILVVE